MIALTHMYIIFLSNNMFGKMESTLDELLKIMKLNNKEWESCLLQIIMILLTYQKAFNFTHNDLHTNNIIFNRTEKNILLLL